MPIPIYILCSESGVVDRETNLESVFNIFDTFQVTRQPLPKGASQILTPLVKMRITAMWQKAEQDADVEFDHELTMKIPGQKEQVVHKGTFQFTQPRQRLMYNLAGPPCTEAGLLRIQSRVRAAGSKRWIKQDYSIQVQVTDAPPPTTPA